MMYSLIGSLKAQPGKGEDLVGALLEASKMIRDAPGLHSWVVHSDPGEPDRVWMTEVWDSKEAHDASLRMPGVMEHIQATMKIVAGPPERGAELVPRGGIGLRIPEQEGSS
jgi:quinol monooxygenase YgiN